MKNVSVSNTLGLPGADKFVMYLLSAFPNKLTAKGPEVLDRSYDMEYAKQWTILLDGGLLGYYCTYGPKPGEKEMTREYRGVLLEPDNTLKEGFLIFSNSRFEERRFPEEGVLVKTPWQRQDGWAEIPFP